MSTAGSAADAAAWERDNKGRVVGPWLMLLGDRHPGRQGGQSCVLLQALLTRQLRHPVCSGGGVHVVGLWAT